MMSASLNNEGENGSEKEELAARSESYTDDEVNGIVQKLKCHLVALTVLSRVLEKVREPLLQLETTKYQLAEFEETQKRLAVTKLSRLELRDIKSANKQAKRGNKANKSIIVTDEKSDEIKKKTSGKYRYKSGSGNLSSIQNKIILERLLSSPLFWRTETLCGFIWECHRQLDGNKSPYMVTFAKELNDKARAWKIWPGDSWSEKFDEDDYKIISSFHEKSSITQISHNTKCILDLIRAFANKFKHYNNLRTHEKKKLHWGENELNYRRFVDYWVKKFPKFFPFLFELYGNLDFKKNWQKYYPLWMIEQYNEVVLFPWLHNKETLSNALMAQIDNGYVDAYLANLEFTVLHAKCLNHVLNGASLMVIKISNDLKSTGSFLMCEWYDTIDRKNCTQIDKRVTYLPSINIATQSHEDPISKAKSNLTRIIAIADKLSIIGDQMYRGFLKHNFRVVIITNAEHKLSDREEEREALRARLKMEETEFRYPIWEDLSAEKKAKIQAPKTTKICFQGRSKNFIDIVTDSITRNELYTKLKGPALNLLLQTNEIEILKKPVLPEITDIYVERWIQQRGDELSFDKIKGFLSKDIFIVFPYSFDTLQFQPHLKILSLENENILSKLNEPGMYLVECEEADWKNAVKTFRQTMDRAKTKTEICTKKEEKGIHFLQYDAIKGVFLRIHSYCSFDTVSKLTGSAHCGEIFFEENNLYETVNRDSRKERLIFIADNPGMGKTQMLSRLATKLLEVKETKIVVFCPVNEFIGNFESDQSDDDFISNSFSSFLELCFGSKTEFDDFIRKYWFHKEDEVEVVYELLLDGLDEINLEQRKLAFKVLSIIRNDFPSVRTWVTLRDHMLEDIWDAFGCLGYKMKPLTQTEQLCYLVTHWINDKPKNEKCIINVPPHKPQSDILKYIEGIKISLTIISKEGKRQKSIRGLQNLIELINTTPKKYSDENFYKFAFNCIRYVVNDKNVEIAGIPLQLWMIAETNKEKVITHNFGNDKPVSLIQLYHNFFDLQMRRYITVKKQIFVKALNFRNEGPYKSISMQDDVVKTVIDEIEALHVYFAIKVVISDTVADLFKTPFIANFAARKGLVEGLGIIRNLKKIDFFHRTFAEYIIAKFVHKTLATFFRENSADPNLDKLPKHFQYLLWNQVMATTFADDEPRWRQNKFRHPTLCQFLNMMCDIDWVGPCLPNSDKNIVNLGKMFKRISKQIEEWNTPINKPTASAWFAAELGYNHLLNILKYSTRQKLDLLLFTLIKGYYEGSLDCLTTCQFTANCLSTIYLANKRKWGILHHCLYRVPETKDEINEQSKVLEEVLKILQNSGEDILQKELEAKNNFGQTPFLLSVWKAKVGQQRFPIPNVISTKSFELNGKECIKMMDILIECGANVYTLNSCGQNALHVAVMNKNYHIVEFLIKKARDPRLLAKDYKNLSPLDYARSPKSNSSYIFNGADKIYKLLNAVSNAMYMEELGKLDWY